VCILSPLVLHVYLASENNTALFDKEKRQNQHSEKYDGDGNFDMKWCSGSEDREPEEDECNVGGNGLLQGFIWNAVRMLEMWYCG
jgi:hypothetical protein